MSIPELPSTPRLSKGEARPRHAQQEIAELLAAAIVRARNKGAILPESVPESQNTDAQSEVSLGFSGDQRVNVNPSQLSGVRQ